MPKCWHPPCVRSPAAAACPSTTDSARPLCAQVHGGAAAVALYLMDVAMPQRAAIGIVVPQPLLLLVSCVEGDITHRRAAHSSALT